MRSEMWFVKSGIAGKPNRLGTRYAPDVTS